MRNRARKPESDTAPAALALLALLLSAATGATLLAGCGGSNEAFNPALVRTGPATPTPTPSPSPTPTPTPSGEPGSGTLDGTIQ